MEMLHELINFIRFLGPKFSSKGADKILEANITFDDSPNTVPIRTDPLLGGVNSYITVSSTCFSAE